MPRRRAIKAVMRNFLETYTSRYSDYEGYWLFGQVIDKFERLEFSLLVNGGTATEVVIAAVGRLAVERFAQQLKAARISRLWIRDAQLTMVRLPGQLSRLVNCHERNGHLLRFAFRALSDHGKVYACEKQVFVAFHDPTLEMRRSTW